MRALASKAIHSALSNPFTANAVLTKAVHDVKVDTSYTTFGLLRLGLLLRSLHASAIPSFTLPSRAVSNYGGFGDVLLPEPAQDTATIAAWLGYRGARATVGTSATAPAAGAVAPVATPPWDPTPC